jgi:hypothetical protein
MVSNTEAVDYYVPFTDEELQAMTEVGEAIEQLVKDDGYWQRSFERRVQTALGLLNDFASRGLIMRDSIVRDDDNGGVYFEYNSGAMGYVDTEIDQESSEKALFDGGSLADDLELAAMASGNKIGNAVILNSFPEFEKDPKLRAWRTDGYRDMQKRWTAAGLPTTLWEENDKLEVSVADYKHIHKYNIVLVATHGDRIKVNENGKETEYPAIVLAEYVRPQKNQKYAVELKDHQIVAGDTYCILPKFFEAQFGEQDLRNTIVVIQCCESMGAKDVVDYSMAKAVVSRGAAACVGFVNSVLSGYGRDFSTAYIEGIIAGKTHLDAFENARNKVGDNHRTWYNAQGGNYDADKFDEKTYYRDMPIAYPGRYGINSFRLG